MKQFKAMNVQSREVLIESGTAKLEGELSIPENASGLVLFAHGSGSSRHSPRNRFVAEALQAAGLVTVLADLLTREEELLDARTGSLRFDIEFLTKRVVALTDWITSFDPIAGLSVGLFGASTGAAAALAAAALRPEIVKAVVSRGGRPDLAGDALYSVHQPTLLIVGGRDPQVLELNRRALEKLAGENRLEVIPGASHLFEEPGALEQVARFARDWLLDHM